MNNISEIHNEAMEIAERAFLLNLKGINNGSIELFSKAFELEKKAAMEIEPLIENEPSRSILFSSAASLAINAKLYNEAKQMVNYGLTGHPPIEIEEELRNIYEQIKITNKSKIFKPVVAA